jgi:Arc/MetJ-type ribon-helix-helix transcriptional regulator
MMIEIHNPEAEAIIRERISAGGFKDAEEVIIQALRSSPAAETPAAAPDRPAGRKSLAQLFADSPFKGLDIDFERETDCGRDVTL